MAVEIGKIYDSVECGKFKVICKDENNINRHPYYLVEFLQTGYRKSARYDAIQYGNVYDPYYPKICGIGYMGESDDGSYLDLSWFRNWENIIEKCYKINHPYYYAYGGKGVTVCERWHCYANFLKDLPSIPGYYDMISHPQIKYHLDKDTLQSHLPYNQRVYSPQTCRFITAAENAIQVAKDYFDEHSNKYYNVIHHRGKYNVELQINGETYRIGRYEDPIVAANAANHAREIFGLEVLNTNVPYISKEEVNAQNLRTIKKPMIKLIN